ncbi:MAG: hypothetical protein ACLFPL_02510 [Candidatus Nanoarchaeia archaeon]
MNLDSQTKCTQVRRYHQLKSFLSNINISSISNFFFFRKNRNWDNNKILELGCGAGLVVDDIFNDYKVAKIIGVDKCIDNSFNDFRKKIYKALRFPNEDIESRLSKNEGKQFIRFDLNEVDKLEEELTSRVGENIKFDVIYSFRTYYYIISDENFELKNRYLEIIQNHIKYIANLLTKNGIAIIDLGYLNPNCNNLYLRNNSNQRWNEKIESLKMFICRSNIDFSVELKIVNCEVGLNEGKKVFEKIPILRIIKK